jgi:branched-chain amino acid transport system permease protein
MGRNMPSTRTAVIALAIVVLAVFPYLGLRPYYLQLSNMVGITLILLLGLNLIMGYAGQISIAQFAFYGIGAYTAALLQVKLGWPFPACALAAVVAPVIVAAVMGPPILRLKGFYLALATIALGTVVYEVFQQWQDLTGGPIGVLGLARPDYLKSPAAYYYLIWFAAMLAVIFVRNVANCAFGRALMAIRENDVAAATLGINLARFKLIAFMGSAAMAGLAGVLYAYMNLYVSPDSFQVSNSMLLIASMVIGSSGSIMGAIIGATLLVLVPELAQVSPELNLLLFGLALVITLRFAPRGLWGLVSTAVAKTSGAPDNAALPTKPAGGQPVTSGAGK